MPEFTDDIDLSKSFAPVPWSTYRDDLQTVARPMQGQEPTEWRRLTIYGLPNEYGILTPAYLGGEIKMLYPSSVADENPADLIVPELHKWPARGGPRGHAITTPYWLVRGHTRVVDGVIDTNPRIPAWVSVDMVGRVYYLMRDGSIDLVAQVTPRSYVNDFSYFEHERKVTWLSDTAAGEILQVRRSGREFTPAIWAKVPGRATSVRAIGGKLYVANETSVIEIDALEKSTPQRVVCSIPGVFWVDYLSDGRLVVMTRTSNVHIVDPASGSIGPDLNVGPFATKNSVGWVMVDVDRNGTCGPVDSIYCIASHSLAINSSWRIAPDGGISRIRGVNGGGRSLSGASDKCIEGFHYGWVAAIHPDEGLQLMHGGAQMLPIVYAAIGPTDPWPIEDVYDVDLCGAGWQAIFKADTRKPFQASMGVTGNSLLGLLPDHIVDMPLANAEAFIRGGMLSSEPRDLTKDEVHGLLYWLYRGSQQFQREGKPVMDRLADYFSKL
ncbi:MAG: hypothetical protein KAX77_00290 [Xanthomonadales bacterium]|nr:hypothetical protein [Xanthomonadales bacterium]